MPETLCPHHSGIVAQFNAICTKLELIEKAIQKQFEISEKEVDLARKDMERRLESMNELRAQLDRQAKEFITRVEVQLLFEKMDLKIDPILASMAEKRGTAKWTDYIITAIISGAIFLIAHYALRF